jgi:hypothetical protein
MANDLIIKLLPTINVQHDDYRIQIDGIYSKQEALILAKKIKSVVYESKRGENIK